MGTFADLCFDVWVNPGDPVPRLKLATYLEENQVLQGEFVRYLRRVDVDFQVVKTIIETIAPEEFASLIWQM